ncbi:MAG: DEAD/DEAH box helicase [Deltaproteobacteria bacterium]|jgi:superfamily II RNA helicase|nr:DEAD/DEAH box helicase [Deltaproteobacteria bacterium]
MPKYDSYDKTFARRGKKPSYKPHPKTRDFKTPTLAVAKPTLVSSEAQNLLNQIGVPDKSEFVPDPFQLQAVDLAAIYDVIVAAPTGSGKTWIATEAIARELAGGGRAWYASPLKALSNAKYLEFRKIFGEEMVGLVTGDNRFNVGAPVVVGTTEILRNQLYDAMSFTQDGRLGSDLVVLDEAHYLGDPERGVVWEEVLIYLPTRVRLLLLSATIANAKELADWLTKNRAHPTKVVLGGERPVPLAPLCLHQGTLTTLQRAIRKDRASGPRQPRHLQTRLNYNQILKGLESLDLTPAIFFLASRKQCDEAAKSIVAVPEPQEKRLRRHEVIQEYLSDFPFLSRSPRVKTLENLAVAAHHAGHLPSYKMLVEDLMSQGLLKAIFATSTVSAGVNFPARTVVIPQSDRFNGSDFRPLSATELAQMTGRAGRRGQDLIGFAIILPGPYTQLKHLEALFHSEPEPIRSQLVMNFSMVLNLIGAMDLGDIHLLLARSLAAWQKAKNKTPKSLGQAVQTIWSDFEDHLIFLKKEGLVNSFDQLTEWGELAARLRLEHPLVFYQAIRQKALPTSDPALLAGVVASFINDKPSIATRPTGPLKDALNRVIWAVAPLVEKLGEAGFPVPACQKRAAIAAYDFASDKPFSEVTKFYGQDEGDAVRLFLRTAEYLNQLRNLPGQKELSQTAAIARQKLLREPVL